MGDVKQHPLGRHTLSQQSGQMPLKHHQHVSIATRHLLSQLRWCGRASQGQTCRDLPRHGIAQVTPEKAEDPILCSTGDVGHQVGFSVNSNRKVERPRSG